MYTPEMPFNNGPERIALGFGKSGVTDYGCMVDSQTYDLLAYRFTEPDTGLAPPESMLKDYCQRNNIDMPGMCVMDHMPIRPDICRDFKDPIIEVTPDTVTRLNESHTIWKNIPLEEKLQIFKNHNLVLSDFIDPKFGFNSTFGS